MESKSPTLEPTRRATADPTLDPTMQTIDPTLEPTMHLLSEDPTLDPTMRVTLEPSIFATLFPSVEPTDPLTMEPSLEPTAVVASSEPSLEPTHELTLDPTLDPTLEPTIPVVCDVIQVQCGATVTGSTRRECGAQQQFSFTPETSDIVVSTCGSSFDTMLAVTNEGQIVHFQDDSPGCGLQAHLDVSVSAMERYVITLHGYDDSVGDFQLALTCTEPTLIPTSQPTSVANDYACMFGCEESQTTCDFEHSIAQPCRRRSPCSLDECLDFCTEERDCRYAFRNNRGTCYLYDDCTSTRRSSRPGFTRQRLGNDVPDSDAFFSVTGNGIEVNGNCVQSRNYPGVHGNNEAGQVNVLRNAYLTTGSTFSVESCCDQLYINGIDVESSSRVPTEIARGASLTWSTDYSVTRNGWQICFTDANPESSGDVAFVDLFGSSDAPSSQTCSDSHLYSTVCSERASCSLSQCAERCAVDRDCRFFFSNVRGGCMLYTSCDNTRTATSQGRTRARVD